MISPAARFSNRPFRVKHFQAIHHHSVDVAHGLVLLFGIGTKALPLWDSKTRWNNLLGGLTVRVTAGSSDITNSPHPSSREGHLSTAWWNSSVLLLRLIQCASHAAATSRVQRNSVEVKTVIGGLSPNRMNLGRGVTIAGGVCAVVRSIDHVVKLGL